MYCFSSSTRSTQTATCYQQRLRPPTKSSSPQQPALSPPAASSSKSNTRNIFRLRSFSSHRATTPPPSTPPPGSPGRPRRQTVRHSNLKHITLRRTVKGRRRLQPLIRGGTYRTVSLLPLQALGGVHQRARCFMALDRNARSCGDEYLGRKEGREERACRVRMRKRLL